LQGMPDAALPHRRCRGRCRCPMGTDPAVEAYLAEAASWDRDRAAAAQRGERRAWVISAAGWVMAGMAVAAVLALTPLKRVVPFVIRVDNSTGIVDVVPPLD